MAIRGSPAAQKHRYVAHETWETATFARRSVAWLVDLAILMIAVFAAAAVLGVIETKQTVLMAQDGSTTTETLYPLPALWSGGLIALFSALYAVPLWRLTRATLGQRLLALRVTDVEESGALSWRRAAIRWLLLFGWAFPVIGSGVAALTWVFTLVYAGWFVVLMLSTWRNVRGQGVHDRAARSLVTKRERWTVLAPPAAVGRKGPPAR
jgi:hypothetical protein